MSNSALTQVNIPAYSGNYTKGRSTKITKITLHHVAGVVTAERLGKLFQAVGRNGSSHYGIGNDGTIAQFVPEEDTAWTDGNWDSNCQSVTIETSNSATGGDWKVSDAALQSLIKLCADIAKRNGLGKLVAGKNLTWHSMYAATACPGPYLKSKVDYIAAEANKINYPEKENVDEVVYTVVYGDTLSGIAAKYGTTYQKLAEYNGIANPNVINAGQKIKIPGANKAPDPVVEPEYRTYTVKDNDNLWNIAVKYLGKGTRYKEIMALNGLTSDVIHAGMVLKIPN